MSAHEHGALARALGQLEAWQSDSQPLCAKVASETCLLYEHSRPLVGVPISLSGDGTLA